MMRGMVLVRMQQVGDTAAAPGLGFEEGLEHPAR